MPTKKRDWPSLKLEFFQSGFDNVESFLRHKGITANRKYTTGRSKEKADYEQKIIERALEAQEKKEAESLKIPASYLLTMKRNAIIKFGNILSDEEKYKNSPYAKNVYTAWQIAKTEIGEPTKITQNTNIQKEEREELNDEEYESLERLLKGTKSKKKT